MNYPSRLCRALAAIGAVPFVSLLVADDGPHPTLNLRAIHVGLERSPERYVAALIEVVGSPRCVNPEDTSTCSNDVKLVDVLAKRGGDFEPDSVLSVLGNGAEGGRSLAFLVPIPDRPGVYGSTFLSTRTTAEDRSAFASALAEAGLLPK